MSAVDGNILYGYITDSIGLLQDARDHGFDQKKQHKFIGVLNKAVALFPADKFQGLDDELGFYQANSLCLQTELCWALSSLPPQKDHNWSQMGVSAYEGLQLQLYNWWLSLSSDRAQQAAFVQMSTHVTNQVANWKLITTDDVKEDNLKNSPRKGMGRVAFMMTHAVVSGYPRLEQEVRNLWVQRCGEFDLMHQ